MQKSNKRSVSAASKALNAIAAEKVKVTVTGDAANASVKSEEQSKGKASKAAGKAVKATAEAKGETVQAVTIALDVSQDHAMRVKLAAVGVDLFATHAMGKTSKGYVAQVLALKRSDWFKTLSKSAVRLLIVNGVSNLIRLDEKSGFYGRNSAVVVRDFTEEQMLIGNVNTLQALYGSAVTVLTLEEAKKRFDGQKETVTRLVGSRATRKEIKGRIIASGDKSGKGYDVLATAGEKGLVFVNCEAVRNEHSAEHNYATKSVTAAK